MKIIKRFFLIFAIVLVCWFILLFITSKTQVQSDNIGVIGFPFVFDKEFYGKGDYSKLDLGINYINLIIDLCIVLLVAFGLTVFYDRYKSRP